MALPVDKILIYCRWIHIYLWPARVWQGLPDILQSENPRPRTHQGETLRMWGQRVRQKLQHSLQVKIAGIEFLLNFFFKSEAGSGMVDPEKVLDLQTKRWQTVIRDILFRDRGVCFEVYMSINIRYFSHKRTGQTYSLSFSKELPGTCLLRDFDLWQFHAE